MKRCRLVDEFEKNKRKYIRYKHQFSKKSNYERELRILRFLRFCCKLGIKRIKDINKYAFDEFMRSMQSKSLETQRKYRLVVAEFAKRAGLNLTIRKDVNRQKEKKFVKLKQILENCSNIDDCKDEIMKLF